MKIWSLTATDSSAGAGAFQDVSIAKQLLVSCEVVVIAITAQNSQGAQQAFTLPLEQIKAQWHSLQQDGWPQLIRLGWLPANPELLAWLVDVLNQCPATVLWDPVLSASQGNALSQNLLGENCKAYVQRLLKRAALITPNLNEARLLAGLPPSCSAEQAAKALQQQGAQHVLITGISAEQKVQDYFAFAQHSQAFANELPGNSLLPQFYMEQTRLTDNLHGTGCRFIASLACYLALGRSLYDSLLAAAALVRAQRQGKALPERSDDWPKVLGALAKPSRFKPLTKELGLYGLVDNLAHLTRLLELGIDTLQWRVKTPAANYKAETQVAIERCRKTGVLLFINDDWQLALELGADGVHLGQEDLNQADLNAIAKAGLYLGVSTHGDWELARARALGPSYIALGPIFAPLSKKLRYSPLGCKQVANYVRTFAPSRFTTIGGITEDNAAEVWRTGIGSVAVITALANDAGLAQRFAQLKAPCP